jgi:hypothetical protein
VCGGDCCTPLLYNQQLGSLQIDRMPTSAVPGHRPCRLAAVVHETHPGSLPHGHAVGTAVRIGAWVVPTPLSHVNCSPNSLSVRGIDPTRMGSGDAASTVTKLSSSIAGASTGSCTTRSAARRPTFGGTYPRTPHVMIFLIGCTAGQCLDQTSRALNACLQRTFELSESVFHLAVDVGCVALKPLSDSVVVRRGGQAPVLRVRTLRHRRIPQRPAASDVLGSTEGR